MVVAIYYDPKICDGVTLAKNYIKYIQKDFQTVDKDGKPFVSKYDCHIDFLNSRLDFISINTNSYGLRAEIALIPDHLKDSILIKQIVLPIVKTEFIGYYDQSLFH